MRGDLRDAPNQEYSDESILLDVAHADPQAQVHLRGGSADQDGAAASSTTLVPNMCPATNGVINLSLWQWKALGVLG